MTPRPQTPRSTRVGAGNPPAPPASGSYFASEEAREVPSPGRSLEHRCWTLGRGLPLWSLPPAPSLWEGREILNAWGSS